jgi:hypothetical protein
MTWAGFKPTTSAFKRTKTVRALDRAATVTDSSTIRIQFSLNTLCCRDTNRTYFAICSAEKKYGSAIHCFAKWEQEAHFHPNTSLRTVWPQSYSHTKWCLAAECFLAYTIWKRINSVHSDLGRQIFPSIWLKVKEPLFRLIAICFDRPVQDQLTILLGTRTLYGVMGILRRHLGSRQRSKNNLV